MKNEKFEYALKMGHLNMVKNNLGDALTARNARRIAKKGVNNGRHRKEIDLVLNQETDDNGDNDITGWGYRRNQTPSKRY